MKRIALALAALTLSFSTAHAETEGRPLFREIYKELIEINTTLSVGSCTAAAEAMKARLKSAGYPDKDLHVIIPAQRPKDGALVAVYPGTDKRAKAILLLGHLDVVEADAKDWAAGTDPFKLREEGGHFYARGATDMKSIDAIWVDTLMRFRQEGYQPRRSVKMALTCGEESPDTFNGASHLLETNRKLIDAEFALNEGGGGRLSRDGKRVFNGVRAGEKVYQDFTIEAVNPGGHSSRPTKDNAIYQLAGALKKIEAYEFPIEFNDTTRGYFMRMAEMNPGPLADDMKAILKPTPDAAALARIKADPSLNGILHTTCVATMLTAGHAPNALPQRATANVNCRIFPGHKQTEILETLTKVIGDPKVKVNFKAEPEATSPPPPLTAKIMGPIEKITAQMWPGVPVVPIMAAGATDGRFLTPAGIPTYGVSGIFNDPETSSAHGLNERVPVQSLYEGRDFLYALVKEYAGGK